jgi:quercetin dioxygenase-like cupin family protein
MSGIRVIDLSEAQIVEDATFTSRRVVRREHGSTGMSFNVSTLREGFDDQHCVYPDHDEIVYLLSGTVELTIGGKTLTISAGKAIYIPRGKPYGYKVVKGPNEVIAVFTPAKS